MLIGHGFDIHRLTEGKDLVIGGVNIPYELGADAHSDGDVIYHSVVDAILGERVSSINMCRAVGFLVDYTRDLISNRYLNSDVLGEGLVFLGRALVLVTYYRTFKKYPHTLMKHRVRSEHSTNGSSYRDEMSQLRDSACIASWTQQHA